MHCLLVMNLKKRPKELQMLRFYEFLVENLKIYNCTTAFYFFKNILQFFFLKDAAEFDEETDTEKDQGMDDWVYSAEETEEGHKFASIKLRRKKLNCYNGCITYKEKD